MRKIVLAVAIGLVSCVIPQHSVLAASCSRGGACSVGDTGPAGGTIVFDAGSVQWWGQYLEAMPMPNTGELPWSLKPTESLYPNDSSQRLHIDAKGIGMGRTNTANIVAQSGPGQYAASVVDNFVANSYDDWFLPSVDELNATYFTRAVKGVPKMAAIPYWSSSENSANYAWYQFFQDGTQFTDESGVGAIAGIKQLTRNRLHRGSGFPSLPFGIVAMRAFPTGTGVVPPVSAPVLTGTTCTVAGPCRVGDIGPAGGVVFYDAGIRKTWGRYLEAAPIATEGVGLPWKRLSAIDVKRPIYRDVKSVKAQIQRVLSTQIGMGRLNTDRVVKIYGRGRYAARYADALVYNGFDDWYLPSKDELNVMYSTLGTAMPKIGGYANSFYWSSSEYDFNNAWTVNFKDGQQFDREKWLLPDTINGVKALRVRAIRAF
jgi:Protein of unknown function (DUF1566)